MAPSPRYGFFLVLLRGMLKDDKISLPKKTVKIIGTKIPCRVVFELPDRLKWEIGVIKLEKKMWFHRGWKEFKEHYVLDHGSFIVLEFDGESVFKVKIYDKTAHEIDYPCTPTTSTKNAFEERDSTKFKRDLFFETRGKSSLSDPRPLKKVKLEDPWMGTGEFRDPYIISDDEEDGDEPSVEGLPISKSTKSILAIKKIQALENTSSFKSVNPFFRVVMQPSYVSKGFNLFLPCKFSRKYMPMTQGESSLKVANGGTWPVSYVVQDSCDRARFMLGWKEFVRDNHLKVGDICVFELIETRQLSFKVSIFPADRCQDPSSSGPGLEKLRSKTTSRVLDKTSFEPETEARLPGGITREDNLNCHGSAQERAFGFTPPNPSFVTSIYQSHITGRGCLFLPTSFKRKHLKGVKMEHLQDIVLQTTDGKKCSATLYLNEKNQDIQVRIGWHNFLLENNLKKGDCCVLELIVDLQITFTVHIFHGSQCDTENIRGGRGRPKSFQIQRKHVTQNPNFEIYIGTSSILQASLNIPGKFAKKYLSSKNIDKVTLKVGDRKWVAKVKKYGGVIKLSGGWRTFAKDIALQVRDTCIFELGDNFEFEVLIFKSDI